MTETMEHNARQTDQQRLLGQFQELLEREPDGLTLVNLYKELPITHPASILEIRGDQLELATSELQLAAISQCSEVFIRSPHLEQPVLGKLESIDIRRGLVRLGALSWAVLEAEQRETVRVRFQKPVSVVIHYGSSKRLTGVVQDISLGGCGVNILVRNGLAEAAQIQMELKVIDKSTGLPNCARIPATLIQITGHAAPFRCAFTFQHNQQSEQFLSVLINQRQLEILRELRAAL
jgi:hypothetical protein